jgi:hypothetical protein
VRRAALSLALLLVLAVAGEAAAKQVRVFAVGPKFSLDWVDTREDYRAHLFALVDRAARGPGAAAVQRNADDVASHRLGRDRDLVALPEDIGLMAAMSGSRAVPARNVTPETGGLTAAIGTLLTTYSPQMGYYAGRYPSLAGRGIPTRQLALALTDTFGRVAVETFAELADRYDLWLEAGVNMARDWRIVCRSKASYAPPPGGAPCAEENPALVSRLMTTDEDRGYAYEATTDQPVNMALIFDPDGKLVSKQVKTYLTPVELPGQLDLVPGHVSRGLSVLDTRVGRLGFVTSKDAWMPDVTSKLDQAGVEILVQPEFFVGDTVRPEGMWAPDNLRASGASDVLRHPSIHTLVLPELTGNVFDFSADAQQHIVVEPSRSRRAERALVGQEPFAGFAKVQEWVVPDPAGSRESVTERRRRLGAAGTLLLPGSGVPCPDPQAAGPCEGGQVEGVIRDDIEVGAPSRKRAPARRRAPAAGGSGGRTPFGVSKPLVGGAPRGVQRNVALAARGRKVFAAYEQAGRLVLARSLDAGRTWQRMPAPVMRPGRQWWPSLSAGPDGLVWLAWCDDSTGTFRAYAASSAGGRRFGPPVALDATPANDVAQWRPVIAATGRRGAIAAWVDERTPVPGETGLAEAGIYTARLTPSGPSEAARRLDTGAPVALAQTMNHAWAPSIAVRAGHVLASWIDFRTYDWRVVSRSSRDGGASFAAESTVEHAPLEVEALADTPRAAFSSSGEPLLAFTDYRKRDSGRQAHPLYDIAVAAPGGVPSQVDPHGARQVSTFAPALLPLPGGRSLVAWQDHARGDADIQARLVSPYGRTRRVDDAGTQSWNAWRPALARLPRGQVLAAWEDDRDGVPRIFTARARVQALR